MNCANKEGIDNTLGPKFQTPLNLLKKQTSYIFKNSTKFFFQEGRLAGKMSSERKIC